MAYSYLTDSKRNIRSIIGEFVQNDSQNKEVYLQRQDEKDNKKIRKHDDSIKFIASSIKFFSLLIYGILISTNINITLKLNELISIIGACLT